MNYFVSVDAKQLKIAAMRWLQALTWRGRSPRRSRHGSRAGSGEGRLARRGPLAAEPLVPGVEAFPGPRRNAQ